MAPPTFGGLAARHLIQLGNIDEEEAGGLLPARTSRPESIHAGINSAGLQPLGGNGERAPFQAGWWRRDLVIPVLIAVSCTCGVSTMRPTLDCFIQWLAMISALVLACFRIDGLRRTEAEMIRFQDENSEFKRLNETLSSEVEGLYGKNSDLKITNQDLQLNVTRLDEVRQVIQEHALNTQKDVGDVLQDFHESVDAQHRILEATRQIQQSTRRHADMEWRAMLMNRYYALCNDQEEGMKGLMRQDFEQFLSMLPTSVSHCTKDFTFESVDVEGKGYVDDRNMAVWVEQAAALIIDIESDRPGVETPREHAAFPSMGDQEAAMSYEKYTGPLGARIRNKTNSPPPQRRGRQGPSCPRNPSFAADSLEPGSAEASRRSRSTEASYHQEERRGLAIRSGAGCDRERSIGSCSTSGSPYTQRTNGL